VIGKIERLPLRSVWKHEALDFTTWLEANVDVINDALNLSLANIDREHSVGTFSVDLVAEDESGDLVIIENQLERSDHEHLGKLITYATYLEAKKAIWIVSDPRPEHVNALSWLNQNSSASFYLVKVDAVRIGESAPAPLLTLITGPSLEESEIQETKKELSERNVLRRRFWTGLLQKSKQAKDKTKLFSNISPSIYSHISTSSGVSGIHFLYRIRRNDGDICLYIDRKDNAEDNLKILNQLKQSQEKIEPDFGASLNWGQKDGKRACTISNVIDGAGWKDEEKWPEMQGEMIDAMTRFEVTIRPGLDQLTDV